MEGTALELSLSSAPTPAHACAGSRVRRRWGEARLTAQRIIADGTCAGDMEQADLRLGQQKEQPVSVKFTALPPPRGALCFGSPPRTDRIGP